MNLIYRSFILFLILSSLSCKNESVSNELDTVKSQTENLSTEAKKIEKVTLKIEGMTCAIGCAKTIEGKLNELEGVQKASVNFDTKTASIEFDGGVQSVVSLTKTIEDVADGKTYKVVD